MFNWPNARPDAKKEERHFQKIIMHKLSRLQKTSNNYFINSRHYGIQLFIKIREHFAVVKKKKRETSK